MSRRGYDSSGWQGSQNPNMAPLHSRPPRGGIGSGGGSAGAGPPSNSHYHQSHHYPSPQHHHQHHHRHGHGQSYSSPHYQPNSSETMSPRGGPSNHTYSDRTAVVASASSDSPAPEVATTLFVGSISPGVSDSWLTKLLEACGHLRSLKRPTKAFGFAEYTDPDSVLRAIQVLNERQLPAMGAEASSPPKKLLVKADEKTKRFLEQYEQTRITTSDDRRSERKAVSAVEDLVRQMKDPNAAVEVDPSKPGYVVPDHLKDLPPDEVPEEHRGSVLSEIEQFRQAAAVRDAETRRREADFERQRAAERARRAGLQQQASSSSNLNGRLPSDDPQSYLRPVEFQSASTRDVRADVAREPEERDELEHAEHMASIKASAKVAAAEKERSYSTKERQRLARWDKEAERERLDKERYEREAIALLSKWEDWDDEAAMKKELFYTDRKRWRQFRRMARKREEEADERDRAAEKDDEDRAREETEKFLAQQAAEMAKLTEQQRASGVLVPSEGGAHAPIKLNFSNKNNAAPGADGPTEANTSTSNGAAQPAAASKPTTLALLGDAEDEDANRRTSRLKHIQLSSDMSEEERQAKMQKISENLPQDAGDLLRQDPRWEYVDEALIQSKYRPWADAEIEESIGERVEELVTMIVECLQAHKPASEVVEAVEPVLAEEAEAFVGKLWRMVLIDSLAAAEGLRT